MHRVSPGIDLETTGRRGVNAARILIAADEAVAGRDVHERLVSLGYEVAGRVASGEEALAAIDQQLPSLVLMDVSLVGASDAVATARRIHDRYDVPVVFLAADSAAPTLDQVQHAEVGGWLLPPFGGPELRLALELALQRHHTERELRRLNQRLERQVRKLTADLEAARQELEVLSYSVSHDLRAPLRAIDGFADMLAGDYQDRLDEEGCRLLGVVRGQARLMGRLVEALLRFSRLGRHNVQRQEIDQNQLVSEVIDELRRAETGREIQFHVAPLPPARADLFLLRQVWHQLVSNTLKFTRPRATAIIWLGSLAAEQGTVYFVRDNGVGFDMAYAGKLFGIFQRLHGADEYEGIGEGLSLVQRIVHMHGGRVWARAEPERGATFHFLLPSLDTDGE